MPPYQRYLRAVCVAALLMNATVAARLGAGSSRHISLDGEWEFAVDSSGVLAADDVRARGAWRKIRVPGSWQSQFGDLRDYQGVAWYFREFVVPPRSDDQTTIITFGAVDYHTSVFVNGVHAGEHEGGYTPFEFDLGTLVADGSNDILIRVLDPVLAEEGTQGFLYREIPHGKQTWYVQTSGIWQSVRLSIVPERRVSRLHVTPSLDGSVVCDIRVAGIPPGDSAGDLVVTIVSPDGEEVSSSGPVTVPDNGECGFRLVVPDPLLWSPDSPALYSVRVTLSSGDTRTERFGFRLLEGRNGGLYLNGQPFYMTGALDQDFYPATVYTSPSGDQLRESMRKAKEMGLNTLRCHIKIPDPMYLAAADEAGILVWYEIPSWGTFSPLSAARGVQTLEDALERDWNHPSLVALSLINESWGLDLREPEQRTWLAETYRKFKQKAQGRLVVDNSACWGNFHMATDVNDYHTYWAMPENRKRFDETIRDFTSRPGWLFSPHGDGQETGEEPLVLSEFGTWGLPEPVKPLPWWITRGFFDFQVVYPGGFEDRFRENAFEGIFQSWAGLARESQEAQWEALKYQIEEIRRSSGLSGYVITEFTDIMWECNGLLDMWRRPKVASERLADIQQPRVVVPRLSRASVWDDEQQEVRLWFSNFGEDMGAGGRIVWTGSEGERGSVPLAPCRAGTVTELEAVVLPARETVQTVIRTVEFVALDASGNTVARNHVRYQVFSRTPVDSAVPFILHDPDNRLGALAKVPGLAGRVEDGTSVVITGSIDGRVSELLLAGRSVVCFVDSQSRFPASFPLSVLRRDTGMDDGNWASVLNWVRDVSALRTAFPSAPRIGWETAVTGLPLALRGLPSEFSGDALAGMFVGWVHNPAAYIVQLSAATGTIVLCTIPVLETCGSDPFAATLVRAVVMHAGGRDIRPQFRWEIRKEGG